MTIMFPNQACEFTCTGKFRLLLKQQFKSNTGMKGICQNTTPILGSFADYRKKRSNRMIDLHKPSPTPRSPVKKLKISPDDCFFAQIYMMQAE